MSFHVSSIADLPASQQAQVIEQALRLISTVWPAWLMEAGAPGVADPPADWSVLFSQWPGLQLVLRDAQGHCVGVANSIPLSWDGAAANLPDEGWDWAFEKGQNDATHGRKPQTLCALAVTLDPAVQGRKQSAVMLLAMKAAAARAGLKRFVVPVRPNQKHRFPLMSMDEYLQRRTPEGLPEDPWLRTHVRLSGQVVKPCQRSMQLTGRVTDWERWLSVRLTTAQRQTLPTLLVPLQVDPHTGIGRYVEPNVWVEHPMP